MKVTREELKKIIRTCSVDADLNYLDVSNITNMSCLFYGSEFIGDISEWNVSNVADMEGIFRRSKFNNDISKWNVSNVTDMIYMFSKSKFNSSIKDWNLVKCNDKLGLKNYDRDEHLRYLKSNHPEYFFI